MVQLSPVLATDLLWASGEAWEDAALFAAELRRAFRPRCDKEER